MTSRSPAWLAVLRLCRIGTWFSPAADVLASSAIVGLPLGADVVRAMAASVCVYGAGMVWNDVADRAEDRVQRPERPLVNGDLPLAFALAFGTALLAAALALSPCPMHHGLLAALVLVYDFLAKKVAWVGALNMGALRGLNLWTGMAIVAATARADTLPLDALPPGAERALLVAAVAYAVYIVAVTFLGIFEDSKTVTGRAVATVQSAPPIVAFGAIAVVQGGFWPAPAIAALPVLWFLRRNSTRREWPQAEIRRSMMYLLLGTMLYTALLTLAAGRPYEAAGIAAAIPVARLIARRIALT